LLGPRDDGLQRVETAARIWQPLSVNEQLSQRLALCCRQLRMQIKGVWTCLQKLCHIGLMFGITLAPLRYRMSAQVRALLLSASASYPSCLQELINYHPRMSCFCFTPISATPFQSLRRLSFQESLWLTITSSPQHHHRHKQSWRCCRVHH
jgi:hypothetical protein